MIRTWFLLIACAYSFINLFLLFITLDGMKLNDERFLQTNTCPFCYGRDLCQKLNQNSIRFEDNYLYSYFIQNAMNIKNVYFGIDIHTGQKLVIKKLAHLSELSQFDKTEKDCELGIKAEGPCLTGVVRANKEILSQRLDADNFKQITDQLGIDSTRCVSQRLVDMFYEYNQKEYLATLNQNLYILSTLMINIEPLFLKVFQKSDGWPFPGYYGTCGRVIVESFEGNTLDHYLDKPFRLRARISKKLLEAAFTIQENSMEVGIYLTDISFENIAYNQDTDRVYFIDVENSVIVDKRQLRLDNPVFWNETYHLTRFDFDCFDCLKYNVDLMCTNYHVDINFYQVCRFILGEYATFESRLHLLHSIPKEIDERYQLGDLLNKCAEQQIVFSDNRVDYLQTRFQIAKDLINILNKV